MDSGTIDWTVISVGIALAGLILVTTQRMRTDMRADMKALSDQVNKLAERVSRLEERQAHTAGLLEGLQGSLFDRARQVNTGERVAEESESYDPQG
ncbi:MAG: hypothetical protein F4Y91_07840 [Gemmatimonadetes bacterium]|nr:hypothetical protein [Gemmatimonadota bacterium]MYB70345.1 hypothetical protein [Gemmatimonadota bacterium]